MLRFNLQKLLARLRRYVKTYLVWRPRMLPLGS